MRKDYLSDGSNFDTGYPKQFRYNGLQSLCLVVLLSLFTTIGKAAPAKGLSAAFSQGSTQAVDLQHAIKIQVYEVAYSDAIVHLRVTNLYRIQAGQVGPFNGTVSATCSFTDGINNLLSKLTNLFSRIKVERSAQNDGRGATPSPSPTKGASKHSTTSTTASPTGRQVFISYSRENITFAKLLVAELQRHGFVALIDYDCLEPGENLVEGIKTAIENSLAVILIVSPAASQSKWVTSECSYAAGCKKAVVPIMLQQASLPPLFAQVHYLDFYGSGSQPWDKLINYLITIEGREIQKAA